MSAALETFGLGKSYGAVHALQALDLAIPRGGVYGILGPNGAGKSTLLRLALGLINPSRGSVRLLGAQKADTVILRKVGAMIEAPSLYPFLTAADALRVFARMSGFAEAGREAAVLERVGLTDAAHRKARTFSMGMRQRLALAAALLHRPELLILDEPTNGLDPAGIQEMRILIRDLVDKDGVTIILSSHLLDEVEKVCDRVAILDHGKLIAEGTVADLVGANSVEGRGLFYLDASPVDTALALLGPKGRRHGDGVAADIAREEAPALIRRLVAANVQIREARWLAPTLEEIFLSRTGTPS
ncbi:MAG TPA: ABC transporter ATP-binding protein [Hyphomonadaceae bacterium]|nr:ABC transporter ATP-binding protein [Hyphomonadaceae bacterium]